ncbi:MAG TPA: extracellular solute-binding protein [Opitutaceae bacterium]|jgi:spermidine/putrescine transport system substrate-binding protein|nr:extracellular solute-binding protein [Opitutaceae bacterium]HOF09540.1 extracellular solute-binding protein [Opitutaceae bacterium]HOR23980.1 extracellular solute-binding protein [Opitutaceae bacterium]HPK48804.1 extracellular solute-binding protein [Opitutaceae bacterium]
MSARTPNRPARLGWWLSLVALCALFLAGCYQEDLDREATHGLAQDPYPKMPRQHADTLRVLVFADVDMHAVFDSFTERYGIKIEVDTFGSDDDAYQLLSEHPDKWDLIMLSQYMSNRMRQENRLQLIPRQNEFIYRYIDTTILNKAADPQMRYFVPYDYATLGISFNIDYLSGFPRDWDYVPAQKNNNYIYGRVALPDDQRYAMAAIMLLAGLDPENPTPETIEKAKQILLLNVRELGVRFVPYSKIKQEMQAKDTLLAVTWSGTAADILQDNPSCRFLLPEGTCIVSVDGFVVPKASRAPETAAVLIEYLLHPYVSMLVANRSMYASVNLRSMRYANRFLINGPSCMIAAPEKLIHMRALTADEQALYDQAWAEIKSATIDQSKIKIIPIN